MKRLNNFLGLNAINDLDFHKFYIGDFYLFSMVERLVRWNFKTDSGEQERARHRYTFAIVNAPREISRIKEKIFDELAMIDGFREICDYPIPNSNGLHCEVFSFSTEVGRIRNPGRIYANLNQFRKDRDLYERDEGEMIPYIERLVSRG
jgi:hypothetical protein